MRCSTVRRLLSPYMDDALGPAKRDAVSRHLEVCRVCSAELGEYERIRERLRGLHESRPEMPSSGDAYWRGVKSRLDAPPARIVRFRALPRVIGASVAAAVLALGIVVAVLQSGSGGAAVAPPHENGSDSPAIAKVDPPAGADAPSGTSSLTVTPVGGSGVWDGAEEEPTQQEKLITF